jgi:exodeoxyribonuclease VII small subunit
MSAKNNDLNKKLEELEKLVAWFESDDLDIEQAIEKFETANKLAAEIREQLTTLENKITVLNERFDQ